MRYFPFFWNIKYLTSSKVDFVLKDPRKMLGGSDDEFPKEDFVRCANSFFIVH